MFAKFNEPPPSPSAAVEIPKSFDAVVAQAMAADPAARFGSAGELGRAAVAASRGPGPQARRRSSIVIGTRFADCQIEEIAGRGGMGVVYRARQVRLGRTVALKVMSDELAADPVFRESFEREMEVAASIDHPNVIPIHWAGEADGLLYIVMRFVEGRDLRELLMSERPLGPARAVEVIEGIAAALDAAHERGLLHCDVKPSNVLVDDATGHMYLTDFGLAAAAAEVQAESTASQPLLGTTGYIAPEREDPSAGFDPRVDVYSLGCVLWDLLGGIDRLDLSRVEDVPSPLADVVERAVAADPQARFASAGAMARAARAALELGKAGRHESTTDSIMTIRRRSTVVRPPLVGEALSSGLTDQVDELCRTVLDWLESDELRLVVDAQLAQLHEPLHLAVIGAPGAGSSTLINALIARRLMRSGATDKLVTRLRYGEREGAELVSPDGRRSRVTVDADGRLPETLSAPLGETAALEVELPAPALREIILTAVPVRAELASTPELWSSAVEAADALIFLVRADEPDLEGQLAWLRAGLTAAHASAANASVVLTHADIAEDAEPWLLAERRAALIDAELGALVATVVPFSGLLAETANTGRFTERDAARIRDLALMDGERRRDLLSSRARFLELATPVSVDDRARLLDMLGEFGVRRTVELDDSGQRGAVAVVRWLREMSGIDSVIAEIAGFRQRADALKADHALNRLEQLAFTDHRLGFLLDRVEALRLAPGMHVLDLIRAFQKAVEGNAELPPELLDELDRLVTGSTLAERLGLGEDAPPDERSKTARGRVRAWKTFENGPIASPDGRRVASVVARSYEMIASG